MDVCDVSNQIAFGMKSKGNLNFDKRVMIHKIPDKVNPHKTDQERDLCNDRDLTYVSGCEIGSEDLNVIRFKNCRFILCARRTSIQGWRIPEDSDLMVKTIDVQVHHVDPMCLSIVKNNLLVGFKRGPVKSYDILLTEDGLLTDLGENKTYDIPDCSTITEIGAQVVGYKSTNNNRVQFVAKNVNSGLEFKSQDVFAHFEESKQWENNPTYMVPGRGCTRDCLRRNHEEHPVFRRSIVLCTDEVNSLEMN